MLDNLPLVDTDLHTRLAAMRNHIYSRRDARPYADTETFPPNISLCEGGCLYRPPLSFFTEILTCLTEPLAQPIQIYPQQNTIPALQQFLFDYFRQVCHLPAELAANHLFAMGSSQLLEAFLSVVRQPGGVVLMPTSCYHAFVDWPLKWGMRSVLVPTASRHGYKLLAADLEQWCQNNPVAVPAALFLTNPTGAGVIYTAAELADLAAVIASRRIPVFMDEVFRHTEFTGQTSTSLAALPGMVEWVVTANSTGKAWHAPNLRMGWAAVPSRWLPAMQKALATTVTEFPFLLQAGLLGALTGAAPVQQAFQSELMARAELCRTSVVALNNRLPPHRQINQPFLPQAGHFVVLNFDAFANALTPAGHLLDHPLKFVRYLQDYIAPDHSPAGIILSSGWSKGHNDFTVYLAFAQLGFEQMSLASQGQETAAMINFLQHKLAELQLSPATNPAGQLVPVPDFDPSAGIRRGRSLLAEAFRRLELALLSLC